MENNYQLEEDFLAVSLTKPPTQFGVPQMAFYMNCMGSFLGWMVISSLYQKGFATAAIFILLFLIIHFGMALVTFRDSFGLRIFWLNLTKFKTTRNYKRWANTDSFSS